MAAIIFDFDGTIADTFETVVGIFYSLTGRKQPLPHEEIERLRGMSLPRAAEELHIKPWKMPFLLLLGRRRMTRRMNAIDAHPGVVEIIKKLHNEGHQLYIMSSNSLRNIQKFLRRHDLAYEFINVYGSAGLLSKARVLKKVVKQNRLDKNDTWYIGDEVRDVVAAQHAGVRVIAVTWGYNTAEILQEHRPTKLVRTPGQIIVTLEES
jgi:phosphoglycolate phosphatase-like HAD superfamily hydrolase